MIISDNPTSPPLTDQYWQITDKMSRGGAGRQLRRRRGRPASPGHWSSLSSLAAITQINKLSESHINLTTSEAIEALCHLRVLHTHWPRPSTSPLILRMRLWHTFANATVSSHQKPKTKSCFQRISQGTDLMNVCAGTYCQCGEEI